LVIGSRNRRGIDALLEERVAQLASLSALSNAVARAESLGETYTAALDCLAQTLSPDRSAVILFDDDGVLRFRAWRRLSDEYRAATDGHTPWTRETRDPRPVLVSEVADEPSLAALRPVIEREGIRALGCFPLLAGETLLGKFMVYFDEPHVFTPTEVRLAEAIGAHIALEIARQRAEEDARRQNALLQEQTELARRALEIAQRLHGLTEALGRALTQADVAAIVVREGAAALGAAAGWIAGVDAARTRLLRLAALGYRAELEEAYAERPLARGGPTTDAVLERRSVWLPSADAVVEAYPALERDYRAAGFEAMAVVPVVGVDRALGAIALNFAEPKPFAEDEKSLLVALAAQCAQALERAELYAQLQERADAAAVLAHVGDGVVHVDRDERIALWNRGAEVITGVAEADAIERRVTDLFGGWEEILPRISITDVPLAFGRREALPVRLADRELWLAISGVTTGEGIVYAFRDVTEAERLEKARRDFLATMSHELRTPLAAVFGATKTLLDRELDEVTSHALLRVIDSESERLGQILDGILVSARLDDGKVELELSTCDPVALATEVLELERSRAPDGIVLRLAPGAVLPRVACDPAKLRQVLVNLVDNAIKYSPNGGEIVVGLAPVGGFVRISVADQGLGIPRHEQERIFEKFYRLDPNLSRGVGGTGLGLYISREFVTRMGGRLWVRSDETRGATFSVEVPVASEG
jgi:signal transduction histidine kinase